MRTFVVMDVATHLEALQDNGRLLLDAATSAGLDAAVPSCPQWQVRDVLQHVGQVHRWARSYVDGGRTSPPDDNDRPAEIPPDEELLEWFRDGHAALVQSLRTASDDMQCWAFLPAPSPRAFWARRQAHETAIHRTDAELAAGSAPVFDGAFAADGLDELLFGFFARPRGRLVADPALRLGLRATDTGDAWTITIGPDARTTTREATEADCLVSGTASDLYLLLWNRGPRSACSVEGDERVLDLWREKATISWR